MSDQLVKLGRRDALKTFAGAATATALPTAAVAAAEPEKPAARPPMDPDLQNPIVPWDKVLTAPELKTLSAICDMILPADGALPSASKAGVPAFIDEWIGAPYPTFQADQQTIRGGLGWVNTESFKRFGKLFADASVAQRDQICHDIASLKNAKPPMLIGAQFFARLKALTLGGYYTTDEGMREIGYVGNVALGSWDGPPPEVLRHLKLI